MANEQTIRVSARGEFGQLQRGLKGLQSDLKDVVGEINRGARKGGFFDDSQLRALDIFKQRFKSTLDELDKEFQKQNDVIDKMYKSMDKASKDEQKNIQAQINLREKELDVMRRQITEAEKLYGNRTSEASGYKTGPASSGGPTTQSLNDATQGSMLSRMLKGSMMGKLGGIGKTGLALAGVGGIAGILMQAYQQAYQREVGSLDLSQRIRGSGGYSGSATGMYDQIGNRMLGLGYTKPESWQFQDIYSQMGGALNTSNQYGLMRFSRGYGLDANTVASTMGGVTQLGGGSPNKFADMISASVAKSGMTPRILEVMQTSEGLLQTINTTLKDTGAKQILAYQTTLDTLGNKNGMTKLTGQQGANIIQGLNGIYDPSQQNNWQWMGIRALQQYSPKKYGKMDLYGLQENFQEGLQNTDNLPAMVNYLKKASGGDSEIFKRMMQQWLQQGGYNATLQQVDQLDKVTNGFSAFDASNMAKAKSTLSGGNSQSAYNSRANAPGQNILNVNAQYEKALERTGSQFIDVITKMKQGVSNDINGLNDFADALSNVADKYLPNWAKGIASFVGDLALAHPLLTGLVLGYGPKAIKGAYNVGKKVVTRGRGGRTGGGRRGTSVGAGEGALTAEEIATGEAVAGRGALSVAGDALWPIAGVATAMQANSRMKQGDTLWGSLWKSVANMGSFGLYDPKTTHNQSRATSNISKMFGGFMSSENGSLSQMFSATGLSPKSHSGLAESIKQQWAKSVMGSLGSQFGLNTKTKEGTVGLAEAFKKYTGLTASELPKSLQTALSHYKIDYSKLKINEDKFFKIVSGMKVDVSDVASKSLADTKDTHKKILDSTDKIQHGMLDASTDTKNTHKKILDSTDKLQHGMLDASTNTHDTLTQNSKDLTDKGVGSFKTLDTSMKSVSSNVSVAMGTLTSFMMQLPSIMGGGGGAGGGGSAPLSGSLIKKATAVVKSNEGSYTSVNRNDGGALSIGELQWHGNRAKNLLTLIRNADPSTFYKYVSKGSSLANLGGDWSHKTLSSSQSSIISKLLGTSAGRNAEDALAQSDVSGYIRKGQSLGITDPNALMYFADMYNQNPAGAVRVARDSNGSLSSLYQNSLRDPVLGKYGSRRAKSYNEIKSGQIQTVNVKVSFDDSNVKSKKSRGTTPVQDFEQAVSDIVQGTRDSLANLFPSVFGY